MSAPKWTAGPYRAYRSESTNGWWVMLNGEGDEIGSTDGGFEFAEAHLFAAAPDNYDSNQELAAIVRELCAAYNHPLPEASLSRSDAALAKARGES